MQLSEPEFTEFIFPHLSRPKRGPRCKLGYHRLFNLILWVLYTGMQWKCLPIPKGPTGKSEIHYTNVYRAFAKRADDGSLQQAFIASVAHLSDEKKLDVRILHGDGTNTVAKKGETGLITRATNTRMDELHGFHTACRDGLARSEPRAHCFHDMVGQCSALDRTAIDPIALQVEGGHVRAMQRGISDAVWDDARCCAPTIVWSRQIGEPLRGW